LKAGDVDVVVSTAILDEGVDVPNINAVVYARGGKSIRKLLQGIGRGLRKKDDGSSLKFYDFIDNTSGYLLKHSLNRYKTLKKEKFEIKKLDLATDLGYTEQENLYFMENYDTAFDNEVFVYVSDF
jgi:superfamily II DNA or RNA helicase